MEYIKMNKLTDKAKKRIKEDVKNLMSLINKYYSKTMIILRNS